MNNLIQKYQSTIGQVNYMFFLLFVALLPFPQIYLRLACVLWLFTWLLEGRFCQKSNIQDWRKMMPFLMFGGWYIWKVVSGLWADDLDAYSWQLERYMVFGLLVPIGIWGVNAHYDWKQVCRVLVVSCVIAAGVYVFTLYWVFNANYFKHQLGTFSLASLPWEFFADKVSFIKHRLFLCSTELLGIMALLYIRRDILHQHGRIKGGLLILGAMGIMVALILATGSRASILSGLALLTVWLLYKLPIRRTRYRIAFVLLACAVGVFALTQHPRMQEFDYEHLLSIRDTAQEHNIRLNIWGTALDSPADYSLYGLGAGQSVPYLQQKYAEEGLADYAQISYATHNQYLAEWMEIGVPGLIFFILAWISIPYFNKKRARKSAMMLLTLYGLNMLTDCMWGMFDGIALWCVWMLLILLQSNSQANQQPARDAQ